MLQDDNGREGGAPLVQRGRPGRPHARRGGTGLQQRRQRARPGPQAIDHDAAHRTLVLPDLNKNKKKRKNETHKRLNENKTRIRV